MNSTRRFEDGRISSSLAVDQPWQVRAARTLAQDREEDISFTLTSCQLLKITTSDELLDGVGPSAVNYVGIIVRYSSSSGIC